MIVDDFADQTDVRFRRERILQLCSNGGRGDDDETVIGVLACPFQQDLAHMQQMLTSGISAESTLPFCLEPGLIWP